jgi:hypothetical protein
MAKIAIVFGVLLAAVGIGGYFLFGGGLHSAFFGVVLLVCGLLALGDNPKKRMLWMHIAVTIGLLGFLVPGSMSTVALVKAHSAGTTVARPEMVHEQLLVAALCLIFVLLCVRSFIAARRARIG